MIVVSVDLLSCRFCHPKFLHFSIRHPSPPSGPLFTGTPALTLCSLLIKYNYRLANHNLWFPRLSKFHGKWSRKFLRCFTYFFFKCFNSWFILIFVTIFTIANDVDFSRRQIERKITCFNFDVHFLACMKQPVKVFQHFKTLTCSYKIDWKV